jgi:hypothetical protein
MTTGRRRNLPAATDDDGLGRAHLQRLRLYYRSSGWPCHDNVEIDLLACGLVRRVHEDGSGRDSVVLTDAGIARLARQLERNRRAHAEHDALVDRVARWLLAERRLVFRGVALRARVEDRWALSRPDVFSLRQASSSRRLHPAVHEIKVRRADLLGDLKQPAKRLAYQSYSQSFYYVIADGIAECAEIPDDCGVVVAEGERLRVARQSPHRAATLGTAQWVALARAGAEHGSEEDPQLSF